MNVSTETSVLEKAYLLFGWFDFTVFGVMLAVSAFIGIYFGFCVKQDSKVEYLMGGKSMNVTPVAVSLVASYISGVTIMGVPAEIYAFGTLYFLMCFANIIVSCIMNYVYLPLFFELQLTSTYEYLEMRFSRSVRTMSSVLFTIYVVLFLPIVVYVPALTFSQVSGVSVHIIAPVVCIICILYTIIGGIRAVVWTDFIQSFVMLGSCMAVVILGIYNVGGFGNVWQRNKDGGRLLLFEMDPSLTARNTFWTVLIGTTVSWMGMAISQGMVQKYLSLPTLKSAKRALIIFCFGLILMKGISMFTGLIIYSTYYNCDPIKTQGVKRSDQLLAYFVMDTVGNIPGLPGLFVAGVFSAALSTLSSFLNCLSATVYEDFIQPFLKNKEDEKRASYIMKAIVCVEGAFCVLLVFVVEKLGGVLELCYSTQGITTGALLGLFTLGVFFPWANAKGALWGSITSLLLVSTIVFGAQNAIATGKIAHKVLPTSVQGCEFNITSIQSIASEGMEEEMQEAFVLFRVSYWYYGVIGTLTVVIVGIAVSFLTGVQDPKEINPALFAPFVRRYIMSRQTHCNNTVNFAQKKTKSVEISQSEENQPLKPAVT